MPKKKIVKKATKSKSKKKVVTKGKKRGRPAGSKNKVIKAKAKAKDAPVKVPGKRGRPPTKKVKLSTECDDYVPPKSYKFLGYCPKKDCGMHVSEKDMVTKTIFVCIRCEKRARVSQLKQKVADFKPQSKKEFLSSSNLIGGNL